VKWLEGLLLLGVICCSGYLSMPLVEGSGLRYCSKLWVSFSICSWIGRAWASICVSDTV
jgi:hypothetical protein